MKNRDITYHNYDIVFKYGNIAKAEKIAVEFFIKEHKLGNAY